MIRDEPLKMPSNERRIRDIRKLLESMWLVKVGTLKVRLEGRRLTGVEND